MGPSEVYQLIRARLGSPLPNPTATMVLRWGGFLTCRHSSFPEQPARHDCLTQGSHCPPSLAGLRSCHGPQLHFSPHPVLLLSLPYRHWSPKHPTCKCPSQTLLPMEHNLQHSLAHLIFVRKDTFQKYLKLQLFQSPNITYEREASNAIMQ